MVYYKVNKNNNINNIVYFFKKLSINIFKFFLSNINITSKKKFIFLNIYQNIKLINIIKLLTNNILKYQIIFKNYIITLIDFLP